MTEPPRKRMVKPPTGGVEGGRSKPARLKTAKQRTPSQQAWLERQVNDPFSAKARALAGEASTSRGAPVWSTAPLSSRHIRSATRAASSSFGRSQGTGAAASIFA